MGIVFLHGKKTAEEDGDQIVVDSAGRRLFPGNPGRVYLRIKNMGASTVYIRLGAEASTTNYPLDPDEMIELYHFCGPVWAITAGETVTSVALLSY